MQATENWLDSKNQQELLELMTSLFEEQARALRRYAFELTTQKTNDLEMLVQELEP